MSIIFVLTSLSWPTAGIDLRQEYNNQMGGMRMQAPTAVSVGHRSDRLSAAVGNSVASIKLFAYSESGRKVTTWTSRALFFGVASTTSYAGLFRLASGFLHELWQHVAHIIINKD